jgi:hypothetical protein
MWTNQHISRPIFKYIQSKIISLISLNLFRIFVCVAPRRENDRSHGALVIGIHITHECSDHEAKSDIINESAPPRKHVTFSAAFLPAIWPFIRREDTRRLSLPMADIVDNPNVKIVKIAK